ncbi:MAG: hypothetical protein WDO15_19990 [Bacteroidota bacterium]
MDEDLNRLYASEQELSLLFVCFAGVAIFVACLGLLGLAMFAAERCVKEIGIRKVLGATVTSIIVRLSRNSDVVDPGCIYHRDACLMVCDGSLAGEFCIQIRD